MSTRSRDIVPLQSNRDNADEDSAYQVGVLAGDGAATSARSSKARIQLEVAIYVESISAELRTMARDVELESLAYFLEMVRIEASSEVERGARMS